MKILTIYNHGTGGSRTKTADKGEIVNIFGNHAKGREGSDFIITEGVGKLGSPHKRLYVQNNSSESMDYIKVNPSSVRKKDVLNKVVGRIGGLVLGKMNEDILMQASGIGVDENVASTINIITMMCRSGNAPDVINMMGWSRGGVTCIRIAHFLNLVPELSRIPVNIFAIDPVAGRGHDDEIDARTIGKNVNHYVATLSIHENRSSFAPMDYNLIRIAGARKVLILPMPGIHSDTAKFHNSAGKITFHLCAKFLAKHGTSLSPHVAHFIMPESMVALEYEKIVRRSPEANIHWKGQDAISLMKMQAGNPRGRARDVATNHDIREFVNAHHLAISRKFNSSGVVGISRSSSVYFWESSVAAVSECGLV
ncbi:hypothetical protein [Burkholderia ubonensis]|uniref:hypothetical protein n=1 Tax=Burkholderia ubonensis TaxID=101571 RepID=UPI000B18A6F5|nr:hypothetical protein [Burkholderia ubonensis]